MSILVAGEGAVALEARRLLAAAGREARVERAPGTLRGVRRVLILAGEAEEGKDLLRAARAERVQTAVLVTSLGAERTPYHPLHRPHVECRKALEESGIPSVVLLANPVYQDDALYARSILERGVYPAPIGSRGVSLVDARDVAEAAVRALLAPEPACRCCPVVGPEALTGEDVASHYAYALGRPVRYAGDDLETWRRTAADGLPPGRAAERLAFYRYLQETGARAYSCDFARQEKLLGRPPRPFGMFVYEAVREWMKAGDR